MKKIIIFMFVAMLTGCATPGKPAFYYTWTLYRTDVNINLPKDPRYNHAFHATLRLDDDGDYAVMVIYNGGDLQSHFGYVTADNLETWINLYTGFLKWNPTDSNQLTQFTIPDQLSYFHKNYDVEYRFVHGKKLFVINKHSTGNWFIDFSEISLDEANVTNALHVYLGLRTKLKPKKE